MSMNKLKQNINEIIYISRITKVTKKRLRIFLSVLLSNSTVLLDISIIIFFSFGMINFSNATIAIIIK